MPTSNGPRRQSEIERLAEGDKSGVFTGRFAVNPVNGRLVPIYIADYVLMGYGTGAIMAVPGQDDRDWEFAEKFGLEIIRTVAAPSRLGRQGLDRGRSRHQFGFSERTGYGRGQEANHRLVRRAGHRLRDGSLPLAGLVDIAPAILGLSNPDDHLPPRRTGAGSGRPVARRSSRRRGLRAPAAVHLWLRCRSS